MPSPFTLRYARGNRGRRCAAPDEVVSPVILPLSTLLCYLVMAAFHSFFLARCARLAFPVGALLGKPLLSALFCGGGAILAFALLSPHLPETAAVLASVILAAGVYAAALRLTGALTREDLARLFPGKGNKKSRSPAAK